MSEILIPVARFDTLDELRRDLEGWSFASGDGNERTYGHLLSENFPNCERFWKLFVVPQTNRIQGPPVVWGEYIRFKPDIEPILKNNARLHYSMFMNLIYAHEHLEHPMISTLKDFYSHLASVCDLVESFLAKSYLLLLICRGRKTKLLQELTRDEFLQLAANWYDKKYPTVYEYYRSKGKIPPINLPSQGLLVKEFLEAEINQVVLCKKYDKHSLAIRHFRNAIVHDVQIAGIEDSNGTRFIPKPERVQDYRTWDEVFDAAKNEKKFQSDFAPAPQQMQKDLNQLESILNDLWAKVIDEFVKELYQEKNQKLLDMYKLDIR